MFRNGAECQTGVIVFQDVVQLPEVQLHKKYFNEASYLPGTSYIMVHAAEVLHQVEGAKDGSEGTHGLGVSCLQWRSRNTSMSTQHGRSSRTLIFSQ